MVNIKGEITVDAPRDKVWAMLNEPETLQRNMPGCESLSVVGDGKYEAVLAIKIASIKGTFQAKIEVLNKKPPVTYTLVIEGVGKIGFMKGEGNISLEDLTEKTLLKYVGVVQIGGLVARVGQRLIGNITQKLVRQFIEGLSNDIETRG